MKVLDDSGRIYTKKSKKQIFSTTGSESNTRTFKVLNFESSTFDVICLIEFILDPIDRWKVIFGARAWRDNTASIRLLQTGCMFGKDSLAERPFTKKGLDNVQSLTTKWSLVELKKLQNSVTEFLFKRGCGPRSHIIVFPMWSALYGCHSGECSLSELTTGRKLSKGLRA